MIIFLLFLAGAGVGIVGPPAGGIFGSEPIGIGPGAGAGPGAGGV